MRLHSMGRFGIAAAVIVAVGCAGEEGEEAAEGGEPAVVEPPVVEQVAAMPDTTAEAVWAHLEQANYETWALWPEKGRLYSGGPPHGMLLTTYLNGVALEALNGDATVFPAGTIIVKENYMPDSTLAAVTTMFKVGGYNPDVNDWFFTKHLASGELDRTPGGMAMEGRLPGCTNCHRAMQANDYLFTGQLGGGG